MGEKMQEKWDWVKAHVSRNKERYIAGVLLVGTNVIWYLASRNNGASMEVDVSGNHNDLDVTNIGAMTIIVEKPGNSGDILWDNINKIPYMSKSEAGRQLGKPMSAIRKKIEEGELVLIQPGDIAKLQVS